MTAFERVLSAIDDYNKKDTKSEIFEGQSLASEIIYSIKVSRWVKLLNENPSEELLIAARGAHIGRFEIPRENYPTGLKGYYQWKSYLLQYHSEKVAAIMQANSYSQSSIKIVSDIIMRKNIKTNAEAQTLEDAVSLIFLEYQLLPLMAKTTEEKVLNAIVKTWSKMSTLAHAKALKLPLPTNAKEVIEKALR